MRELDHLPLEEADWTLAVLNYIFRLGKFGLFAFCSAGIVCLVLSVLTLYRGYSIGKHPIVNGFAAVVAIYLIVELQNFLRYRWRLAHPKSPKPRDLGPFLMSGKRSNKTMKK